MITTASLTSWLRKLHSSTLLMNALYLMLSTFVVAAAGFIFWVLIAHKYETTEVGLATTLLSVSGLLSLLGLAGFDTTFIRLLPVSDRKNAYVNSGFILVTLISLLSGVCVALALPWLSPQLSVLHNTWAAISFVFFTVVTSLNTLTNAVFLAYRKARYIFVINTLFSLFKVLLPLLVSHGSAMTIFGLAGSAQLLGLVLSVICIKRTFNFTFSFQLDKKALRAARKFLFSVYTASVLNLLPPTLLPLLIIHHIGPKNAAYYYMAFTIAGVIYTIAYASTQSVFAEGSHNEAAMRAHITGAAKLIAMLLLPTVLLVVFLSAIFLRIFGVEYAANASSLLQLFALSALPVAVYSTLGAVFKITKNLHGVISMNIVYVAVIIGLSELGLPHVGLIAVGWAWIIGNIAACGIGMFFLINVRKKIKGKNHATTT